MSESMLARVRKGPGDLALERIPRPVPETLTGVILKTRLYAIRGADAQGHAVKTAVRPAGAS